jgi:hypothetical protein
MTYRTRAAGLGLAALILLVAAAARPAHAGGTVLSPPSLVSGTFDFESNTPGQGTTFTDTSGGISATFSTTADTASRGGFTVIRPTGQQPPGFSGNHLENSAGMYNLPLSVGFDQTLLSGSVAYNSFSGAAFTVQELLNGVVVGTATSNSSSGTLSFGGVAFNSLSLTAPAIEIDNLAVTNAPAAPEPSQLAGLSFTGLGLGALLLRARRKAQAS